MTPFDAAPELVNGEFSPKIAPDYSVPPTRLEQLKASNWRPVAVFAGALLVGGLLAPLVIAPANPGAKMAAVSSWELSLPASSTMLTALSAAPGAPLRGQVAPVADITGKAPVGGAVARWVVEPGARVEAGQPVVQISSGAASAPALPGETKQIEAEQQQTAAADDQLALSQRLTQTQQKLAAAQLRVEQAQQNIGQTRALIARLRAGEAAPPDAASPDSSSAPAPRNKSNLSNSGVAAARAKSRDAQSGYDDTKAQLKTARDDLSAAQQALTPLQSKLDEAQANVKTVEGKWDGSLASASDVQAARSARDNAKGTLKSATTRIETAQKQIPVLEKQLASRERAAEDARRAERATIAAAPAEDANAPKSGARPSKGADGAISLAEASKRVNDALAESRAASREADRLRAQVDLYQSQAQKSNQRIASATEQLQSAQSQSQSQMVQNVPRVRFTAANAPASGVVVWIATLAREVGSGQSVFGMSSGKKYRARFEDRTDGWKNARVGQVVDALMAPPAMPQMPAISVAPATLASPADSANAAGSPPMPMLVAPAPDKSANGASGAGGVAGVAQAPPLEFGNVREQGARPVKVRLTRIAPPEAAGGPAILEGELVADGAAGPQYRLLASLPSVGAPSILTVPDAALVQRDGAWMVAVIEADAAPTTEVTPVATARPAKPGAGPGAGAPGDTRNGASRDAEAKAAGTLAWRKVEVGASDGLTRRVTSGLKPGERIITDPLPLLAQAPPTSKVMPRVKLSAV